MLPIDVTTHTKYAAVLGLYLLGLRRPRRDMILVARWKYSQIWSWQSPAAGQEGRRTAVFLGDGGRAQFSRWRLLILLCSSLPLVICAC